MQDASDIKAERAVGRVGNVAFAFLSAVTIVACVGAAIALGQIKLLKSEIDKLRRELLPLSERLAKLEGQNKPAVEINRPSVSQTTLELSPEEIQLIRDYIKPAPYSGPPGPAINVGDPITATMIPLPSPLTDKIPKLLGARFAIQNGAIIIVKRNSRNAEIVLAP